MNPSMLPALIALVAMSSAALTAAPEEKAHLIRTLKWSEVPLPAGAVLQGKAGESPALLVKHDGSTPLQLPLWKLENPGITRKCYALRGKVRYKGVTGIGFFEMWNEFPAAAEGGPKPRYFSRTLAEQGLLGRITGNSAWREVLIPFDASQSSELPQALELNLSLPGKGEVEVTSLELVEFDNPGTMWAAIGSPANALVVTHATSPPGFYWGTRTTAFAVGAFALVGIVVWFMARKGRHAAEERRMKAMDAMP